MPSSKCRTATPSSMVVVTGPVVVGHARDVKARPPGRGERPAPPGAHGRTLAACAARRSLSARAPPRGASTSPTPARASSPTSGDGAAARVRRARHRGRRPRRDRRGQRRRPAGRPRHLLPADDRWRHRHGSPGHGRSHVMPALVPPYASIPVLGRPVGARHLAERLPRRPERRQPAPHRAPLVPAGLRRSGPGGERAR